MTITFLDNNKIIRIKIKSWEVEAYVKDIGKENIISITD